jgi:hypothetical protein
MDAVWWRDSDLDRNETLQNYSQFECHRVIRIIYNSFQLMLRQHWKLPIILACFTSGIPLLRNSYNWTLYGCLCYLESLPTSRQYETSKSDWLTHFRQSYTFLQPQFKSLMPLCKHFSFLICFDSLCRILQLTCRFPWNHFRCFQLLRYNNHSFFVNHKN